MIKPNMSNMSNIPGMGAVTDTLDFVKNLWGGMSVPGMGIPGIVMPTLSVEEINKQIADLKAVESWLTLNMNMLRGTIQALEVQSATISTLKSMGETLSAAVKPSTVSRAAPAEAMKKPEAAPQPVAPPEPPSVKSEPKSDAKDAAPGFMAPQANPAVWWNMLQDQFKQAVNSAMATEPAKAASNPASAAAKSKAAAKPKAVSSAKRKAAPKAEPKA